MGGSQGPAPAIVNPGVIRESEPHDVSSGRRREEHQTRMREKGYKPGLCLAENVEPSSFGPLTRQAITPASRQSAAEKSLFPPRPKDEPGD